MAVRGVRGRLVVALVALVALTAVVLGAGTYAFVDAWLHRALLAEATDQARFDLAVLVPDHVYVRIVDTVGAWGLLAS